MRAIGLQQIRNEAPGEAATKRFVELLPKLRPEARAELVEALGERGDAAARPAVLEMAQAPDEPVRAAALRALSGVGSEADVPLLVQRTAAGSAAEQLAAVQSLVRLKGDRVNAAITAALGPAAPTARVKLLEILAAQRQGGAAGHARQRIRPRRRGLARRSGRIARLGRRRPNRRPGEAAADGGSRRTADEGRGGVAGVVQPRKREMRAGPRRRLWPTRTRGRGRCCCKPWPAREARRRLEAVAGRLDDEDQAVRDEAVRMLSLWPDRTVAPRLVKIAGGESLRHHVLAIRGLVRLAGPEEDRPADLKLLADAIRLAKRRDEKQLALGVLSRTASTESLVLAVSLLDDPTLAEDAGRAAATIAGNLPAGHQTEIRSAMRKVLERTKSPQTRDQAQKVLHSL